MHGNWKAWLLRQQLRTQQQDEGGAITARCQQLQGVLDLGLGSLLEVFGVWCGICRGGGDEGRATAAKCQWLLALLDLWIGEAAWGAWVWQGSI